jgi:hypothetical protein
MVIVIKRQAYDGSGQPCSEAILNTERASECPNKD